MSPSVDPAVANINPNAFVLANQQAQANLAATQQEVPLRQQQIALGQQEVQQRQIQNQLLQQQLNDAKIMQQTFAQNPNIDFSDPQQASNFRAQLIRGGVSYPGLTNAMENIPKWQQAIMTLRTSELNNELQAGKRATDVFQNYSQLENGSQAQADAWPAVAQKLNGIPGLGVNLNPGQPLSKEEAQSALSHILIHSQITEDALKQQQTKEAQQRGAQAEAAATEAEAKAAHQKLVNDLIQKGQQASQNGQNPIDAIFPVDLDKQTHDSYATAWQAAGNQPPDENGRRPAQDSILSAAASHAAEYRKAVSPTILAGEVAKAVATEQATAPIKTEVAVNTQRALNSTAAVGNVPPHLIPQYQGEVAKVASAYGDAANAANEMQEMIDLMRSGNKVAYAYSPTTGVLTINSANGVRRVNMAEIGQYAGAGSFLDRVTGYFGKQLTGESVPSNIVDAMEQVHGTLSENSRNTAVAKIKSLNAQYGATTDPEAILVKPAKATTPAKAPAAGAYKAGDTRVVNGVTYKRDDKGQWLPQPNH